MRLPTALLPILLAGCSAAPSSTSRPSPSGGPFGPLPPGHVALWEYGDIAAEISFTVYVDSASIAPHFPAGLRPFTLRSRAAHDSSTAALLARYPGYADRVLTTFAFVASNSLRLDGVDLADDETERFVFWWARLENAAEDALDDRARGSQWVELAFWYDDEATAERARAAGNLRSSAPVEMRQPDPTTWAMRLVLPEGEVRATCRLVGDWTEGRYPLPAYSTVWNGGPAGAEPTAFSLYTFYGHHTRPCEAGIEAVGPDPVAVALRSAPPELPPHAADHVGWRARAPVYTRR